MLDFFFQLDKTLFLGINRLPHNYITDSFFIFFSGIGNWGFIWLVIGIALIIWEEIEDKKGLISLIIAVLVTLIFIDGGVKNVIKRPRPQFTVAQTIVVSDNRDSYSFPSGHATLAFAAAFILAREHKKWAKLYYILAILIAFSRIYLGKHYPLDVLGGIFFGLTIGSLSYIFVHKVILRGYVLKKITAKKNNY